MTTIEFKDMDGSDIKIKGNTLAEAVMGMFEHVWNIKNDPYLRLDLEGRKIELLYLDEYSTTVPFTVIDTEAVPTMYCRFKQTDANRVTFSDYLEVGSVIYKTYEDARSWTECIHKTFEELG